MVAGAHTGAAAMKSSSKMRKLLGHDLYATLKAIADYAKEDQISDAINALPDTDKMELLVRECQKKAGLSVH
jgi:hypothetical protein